jgi:outer membrane protein OmpA-like peptidoglycan-associated protein
VKSITTLLLAAVAALVLAGCTDFNAGLHAEYLDQATLEVTEKDYRDGERWIDKANMAAEGGSVMPEETGNWGLPAGNVGEISDARGRLMAAFDKGARTVIPGQAARAQVMLDCWMQEQEEDIQPGDIAACRAGFEQAMAKVDDALKPKPVAAPAPPPPPPAPEPEPVERVVMDTFIVYFAFDSSEISPAGMSVIERAAASLQGAKKYVLTVRGHTDRAGSNAYNASLAETRADNVALALMDIGVLNNKIRLRSFGEDVNAVATSDGAREQFNRRVEINIDRTIVVMMKPTS